MGALQVYIFLTIYFLQTSASINNIHDLCIDLNQGVVCGFPSKTFTKDRHFYSFLGLPYAKPPIGPLRFQDPRKYLDWKPGQKIGSQFYGSICPQWDFEKDKFVGDEDCLYLNVFTPRVTTRFSYSTNLLPVLVFIHGGGGFSEGGTPFYGADLLMDHDLMLVTIQYRLGVFGFLSTQSKTAAGNYGMLDIIMALKWIQDNIAQFGGDANQITLMGQGSGAAAVSLLITSPLTKGLFHKVIAQSGSALCNWSVQENAREITRNLSILMGCSLENEDEMVDCLRNQPAKDLIKAQKNLMTHVFFPVIFAPVIDNDYRSNPILPESPRSIFESSKYNSVPMIVGETTHEGLTLYEALQLTQDLHTPSGNFYHDGFVPDLLQNLLDDERIVDDVWESIKNIYFRDVQFWKASDMIPPFVEFLGDVTVSLCVDKLLREYKKSPVYHYVYAHRKYVSTERSLLYRTKEKLQTAADTELRAYFQGAAFHGDDLSHIFILQKSGRFPPPPSLADFNFTASMLCLFTSFITLDDFSKIDTFNCRNPLDTADYHLFVSRNGSNDRFRLPGLKVAEWPPYDARRQHYLHVNSAFSIRSKYRHREKATLDNLIEMSKEKVELREILETAYEPYHTIMWVLVATCCIFLLAVIALLVARLRNCGNYAPTKK